MYDTSRLFVLLIMIYFSTMVSEGPLLLIHYYLNLVFFTIPFFFSTKLILQIRFDRNCKGSIKNMLKFQYGILIFWPLDILTCLICTWALGQSLLRICVDVCLVFIGMVWELFFTFMARKLVRIEETGVFYSLENQGVKIEDSRAIQGNDNVTFVIETVLAQTVEGWPVKSSQEAYCEENKVEVQDFTGIPKE